MLESLVAGILNRTLGNYVENFDPKQLNIGIWSGDVKLRDLKLKKESLDSLELPIDVKYGFLGQLTLQIPWSNLRGKPVKIIIEDAYILASPMKVEEYDEEKIKQRELGLKRRKLQDLDLIEENKQKIDSENNNNDNDLDEDSKKQESFAESLLTKIVDNLQITIKNIHFRYEDSSVFTEIPYSVGVTLDELSAISTDGTWVPSFVSLADTFARKLLTLKSLSCYFNSNSKSLIVDDSIDEEDLKREFNKLIAKESEENHEMNIDPNINFLLKPVSGSGKITVNKLGATESDPHILSELFFKEFSVNLDSYQYRDILNTASNYRFYMKTFKFKKFRPKKSHAPSSHPLEWFQYAAKAVLSEIHEKNYKWSWEYMEKRRDTRKAYIALQKQKLAAEAKHLVVDESLLKELSSIEDELSYEDIKFYRSWAKAQFRKEKLHKNFKNEISQPTGTGNSSKDSNTGEEIPSVGSSDENTVKAQQSPSTKASSGWFSWWNGPTNVAENGSDGTDDTGNEFTMTEEQKKELFDAIEFDEKEALVQSIDIPKDRVKLKLFASLEKGSLKIKNRSTDLAEVMWEGCNFQLFERPSSYLTKFTLQEFKVDDKSQDASLYRHIVSIKPINENLEMSSDSLASRSDSEKEPFFQVAFESNPIDDSADTKLTAKLKSMTIFYQADFVRKVVKFFTPPKHHLDTITAIMNAAEATVEGITEQTKLGLRYALEEHKTVTTQLDLQAPLIIVPLDPTDWNSPCCVLDAGHISVISDLIEKAKADEVKKDFDNLNWDQMVDLFYDKFTLHLADAKLLVGSNVKSTIEQLQEDHLDGSHEHSSVENSVVFKNFNTNFLVQVSILPKVHQLSRFRVSGNVPNLKAKITDYQYKVLLKIMAQLVPEFDELGYFDEEADVSFNTEDGDDGDDFDDDDSLLDVFRDAPADFADALSYIDPSEDEEEISASSKKESIGVETPDSDREIPENQKNRPYLSTKHSSGSVQSEQHLVDFNLKVGVIDVLLLKCVDNPDNCKQIIELIGERFTLAFYKTSTDYFVDMSLSDVHFIDKLNKSYPQFQKMISSNNFTENEFSVEKEDLIKVKYKRLQRIVEVNGQLIELYDQDVKLDIAAVKGIMNRENLLTIYTYIMTTFTNPATKDTPADLLRHNSEDDNALAPQMINVVMNLERIILVLTDDDLEIATLQLSSGVMNAFILPEKMKVDFKLGALTLHDELNKELPRDSVSRRLISIDGEDLAVVHYETFDTENNANLFTSKLEFTSGSMRIHFIQEPLRKFLGYFMNFFKMKSFFDNARDSNYNQISVQEITTMNNTSRMSYKILVKTPIIVFPRLDCKDESQTFDNVTAYLGEFQAHNEFSSEPDGAILSQVWASLTSTRLTSEFYFNPESKQFLEIIEGIDMSFHIDNGYNKSIRNSQRASTIIRGKMTNSELKLTEYQLRYLMVLFQTVPGVVQYDNEKDKLRDTEEIAINASIAVSPQNITSNKKNVGSKDLFHQRSSSLSFNQDHLNIDFEFDIGNLSLSIYNATTDILTVEQQREKRLSKFALDQIHLSLKMKKNSEFVFEVITKAFTVEDTRVNRDNVFTELIPKMELAEHQFSCKFISKATKAVIVNFESPKMILALDYLFELRDYFLRGLSNDNVVTEQVQEPQNTSTLSYSINVVGLSLLLLADPSVTNSEAIVFKLEQLVLSSHKTMTLQANNVGMFLCRMNDFDNSQLRILDDFSASFSYDTKENDEKFDTVQVSVESLLLRVSLSDVRLAIRIFNKVSELSGAFEQKKVEFNESNSTYTQFTKELKQKITKTFYEHTAEPIVKSVANSQVLNADFAGLRLVLLGDVHELPVMDMGIKPFVVQAENWSTNLDLSSYIESYVNVFNYARSAWEPMVEPWKVGFHVSKTPAPKDPRNPYDHTLTVDVVSRDVAEISLTTRTIQLLKQMHSLLAIDANIAPRGETSPYTILNQTGYDLDIWIDSKERSTNGKTVSPVRIKKNEKISWQFEQWTEIRNNLDVDSSKNYIAVKLVDSPYEPINAISLSGEGEELFMMKPAIQGVHNRLACSVVLGSDNVKQVVLRSTIIIENTSGIGILVGVGISSDIGANEVYRVGAGSTFSLPIDRVYKEAVAIKPDIPDKVRRYNWSDTRINWRSLYNKPASLECKSATPEFRDSFFFSVSGENYSTTGKKVYPHMKMIISSPLQIENLLPYDMSYRVHDKTIRESWKITLRKGGSSNIHFVDLNHLIFLSVEPLESGFNKSEFCIINVPDDGYRFTRDEELKLRHQDGQKLSLNIAYATIAAGTGVKVSIYAPYVILNRTGRELYLVDRYNKMHSRADGESLSNGKIKSSQPQMFSFDTPSVRQRVSLCFPNFDPSSELSLDAVGHFTSLDMPGNSNRNSEINVGIDVAEGEGKYMVSKIVTISPKFIVINSLDEELALQEIGSTETLKIKPNESIPLLETCLGQEKELRIKFLGSEARWSSAFCINDCAEIFLKMVKSQGKLLLIKISLLLEKATLFIYIEKTENRWPFSLRNFSDQDFIFFQVWPYIDDEGAPTKKQQKGKHFIYRLPAKSVMPYAWDYPSGNVKELSLRSHDVDMNVKLSEIGDLGYMMLPPYKGQPGAAVHLKIDADGLTQTLIITNADPEEARANEIQERPSLSQVKRELEKAEPEFYSTRIALNFGGVGVSLINSRHKELCYITLRGFEFKYNESELYKTFIWNLKWLQVDNQLFGGVCPIVLYPTVVPKSGHEANSHPTIHGSISVVKDETLGLVYVKYATILLQELTVDVDEDFLVSVLHFYYFEALGEQERQSDRLCEEIIELPAPPNASRGNDIYFEGLNLQPIQINISFSQTDCVNAPPDTKTKIVWLNYVASFGDINDAPIKLNSLFMVNAKAPFPVILSGIQTHYKQDILVQFYKILGSADALGNPVGLFNNISSGVIDIFYEPYQGLIMNDRPQELGISIAKGGLSFLKKSVFGVSDSFARFTNTMAKNLSKATLDKKFQDKRRYNMKRNRPKHALVGITSGASTFIDSLSSGVSGIAMAPLEGASTEGATGFIKGIGKGLVGLPTKAAIGVFDLASNVSEGIRNTTTAFDDNVLDRMRLPRVVNYDGIVRSYSQEESQGQFWLKNINGGEFSNTEDYLAHVVLPGNEYVFMITFKNVMLISVQKMESIWKISYEEIKSIVSESGGISISLVDNRSGPFVPIPDKQTRNLLYSRIAIAVEMYNKQSQSVL